MDKAGFAWRIYLRYSRAKNGEEFNGVMEWREYKRARDWCMETRGEFSDQDKLICFKEWYLGLSALKITPCHYYDIPKEEEVEEEHVKIPYAQKEIMDKIADIVGEKKDEVISELKKMDSVSLYEKKIELLVPKLLVGDQRRRIPRVMIEIRKLLGEYKETVVEEVVIEEKEDVRWKILANRDQELRNRKQRRRMEKIEEVVVDHVKKTLKIIGRQ